MKGGRTPIHIQRWAPADFQDDEDVKLMLKRGDLVSYAFYRQFLDRSFMAGGDLPKDVERLAAVLSLPEKHVAKGLSFCLDRLLFEDGDRLYQPRVRAEVAEELAFRESQANHGKKRWPKGSQRVASGDAVGVPEASLNPPYALRLTPTPTPIPPPNPHPPTQEVAFAEEEKRPRKRDQVIDAAWEIYDEVQATRPTGGLLAKWRKDVFRGDGDWMVRALRELAPRGVLNKGDGYVSQSLAGLANGNGRPSDTGRAGRPFQPAAPPSTRPHLVLTDEDTDRPEGGP